VNRRLLLKNSRRPVARQKFIIAGRVWELKVRNDDLVTPRGGKLAAGQRQTALRPSLLHRLEHLETSLRDHAEVWPFLDAGFCPPCCGGLPGLQATEADPLPCPGVAVRRRWFLRSGAAEPSGSRATLFPILPAILSGTR
jgi:hypothetical protein